MKRSKPNSLCASDTPNGKRCMTATDSAVPLYARGNCLLDQRYGSGPRCLLDVFPAGDGAPVLLFIHGGYWRALDKSDVSFIAEPFQRVGISVVMPGYDLVPSVRVADIVDQVRAALAWVIK